MRNDMVAVYPPPGMQTATPADTPGRARPEPESGRNGNPDGRREDHDVSPDASKLSWGVYHADKGAFRRARAALRAGETLTVVCGGSEEGRVPARRVASLQDVLDASDVVIVGGDDARRTARTALQAGKHVSAEIPLTLDPQVFLRLAHVATNHRRLLHLFTPALYRPAFRTLQGHVRPSEVRELKLVAHTEARFDDPESVVYAHLPAIQKLVLLGGPVTEISRATFSDGRFEASLLFRSGARGDIAVRPVAQGQEPMLELDVVGELTWHIRGQHLYCGSSMTTLTDNRSPEELGILEIGMVAGGRGRPTLDVRGHFHTLVVLEALAGARPTRL